MTSRSANLSGILAMLVAVASFAALDTVLKLLSPHYPALQVTGLRGLASLPFVLAWIAWRRGWPLLVSVRWPLHLMRGAIGIAMLMAFVYGVRGLPLADAYAIFFVAPLIVTVLAGLVLRERIGWQRWVAIAIGMIGVLVVLRPTGQGVLSLSGLAIVGAATGYAISAITVRVLARTDSTMAMVFWVTLMLAIGASALAWPEWKPVLAMHAWHVLALGVFGTIGQYAVTVAFARGEASVIAPFEYTALLWGLIVDFTLWGTVPTTTMLVGAAIVVASGLYLISRERAHAEAEHP